jgi:hypothetical protein
VRRTGRPLCHSAPAPAGTVWQDRYRHAGRAGLSGFRNCGKLAGVKEGSGKMGRYQRYIYSGNASLHLSAIGSFIIVLVVIDHFTRFKFTEMIGVEINPMPALFLWTVAFSFALAIIFHPPYFKRTKPVLIRLALAACICFLTIACVLPIVAIELNRLLQLW